MIYIITLSCRFQHIDKKPVKAMIDCTFGGAVSVAQKLFDEKCKELGYEVPSHDNPNFYDESTEGYWLHTSHDCSTGSLYKEHLMVEVWPIDVETLVQMIPAMENNKQTSVSIAVGGVKNIEPLQLDTETILKIARKHDKEKKIHDEVYEWFILEFAQEGQYYQRLLKYKDNEYFGHSPMSEKIKSLADEFVMTFRVNATEDDDKVLTGDRTWYDLYDEFMNDKEWEILSQLDDETKEKLKAEALYTAHYDSEYMDNRSDKEDKYSYLYDSFIALSCEKGVLWYMSDMGTDYLDSLDVIKRMADDFAKVHMSGDFDFVNDSIFDRFNKYIPTALHHIYDENCPPEEVDKIIRECQLVQYIKLIANAGDKAYLVDLKDAHITECEVMSWSLNDEKGSENLEMHYLLNIGNHDRVLSNGDNLYATKEEAIKASFNIYRRLVSQSVKQDISQLPIQYTR